MQRRPGKCCRRGKQRTQQSSKKTVWGFLKAKKAADQPRGRPYSISTVDWPEISKRLRQRMFLQAITSSLRTMYERNLAKRARSRSSARPPSCRFLVRTIQVTSYSAD